MTERSGRIVLVLTTLDARLDAGTLARTLVEERLAACVSLLSPMQSVYRWQGQVETLEECQIVIKTTLAQAAALTERLRALHPYEVPEVLVLSAEAPTAYGDWVRAAVGEAGP